MSMMKILAVITISSVTMTARGFTTFSRLLVHNSESSFKQRAFSLKSTSKSIISGLQQRLLSGGSGKLQNDEDLTASLETISFKNTQKKFTIDEEIVRNQIAVIKRILDVSEFQVDVWFCSEPKIRDLNEEWREKRKSTDILSFPANEFEAPGVFEDDPSLEFEKHLGDLVVAPAYVARQCERDQKDFEKDQLDDSEDAGVSKAMARVFSLEERVPLLLVHGMIHLLGYDHETDKEWKEMTGKEEEVLALLSEYKNTGKITVIGAGLKKSSEAGKTKAKPKRTKE